MVNEEMADGVGDAVGPIEEAALAVSLEVILEFHERSRRGSLLKSICF